MEKIYKLKYEPSGTVFHLTSNPPKLIRLGSGEIIQWINTHRTGEQRFAIYNKAEIEDYNYIHLSDAEQVL